MKRWFLFALLFVMMFAAVLPVSAAGNGPRSNFTFVGRIAETGDGTVTIEVLRGNKLAQPNIDQPLTVVVTDSTRFLLNDGTVVMPITFADLEVGDPVSVHGILVSGVWTASRITVGAQLIHFP